MRPQSISCGSACGLLVTFGDGDLDRRDAAMLATLYMLALRRSELVEIDGEQDCTLGALLLTCSRKRATHCWLALMQQSGNQLHPQAPGSAL